MNLEWIADTLNMIALELSKRCLNECPKVAKKQFQAALSDVRSARNNMADAVRLMDKERQEYAARAQPGDTNDIPF